MGFRAVLAVPLVRGRRRPRRDVPVPPRARTLRSRSGRARRDLRAPGRHRPAQRSPVPRHAGGARAADRDERDPARHQPLARPTCSRCSRPSRRQRCTLCRRVLVDGAHVRRNGLLHIGALASTTPEGAEAHTRASSRGRPSRDNGVTRAVFTRRPRADSRHPARRRITRRPSTPWRRASAACSRFR